MIKLENAWGTITISQGYFTKLVAHVVSSCYGVADLTTNGPAQELKVFVGGSLPNKGIRVWSDHEGLFVDVHIAVTYGVNIAAISQSIVEKVGYEVERASGLPVKQVHVYVDKLVKTVVKPQETDFKKE
nr:Asp23/Gls24 family envelope stress response protein [uncultured Solibaculum sp.]